MEMERRFNVNAFEQEWNEHMEVVNGIFEDDPGSCFELGLGFQDGKQPISLNRLALAGVWVEMSEGDYSSSDDSEGDASAMDSLTHNFYGLLLRGENRLGMK